MDEKNENTEKIEQGRRLTGRVEDLLQQGRPVEAKRALARSWQDVAPELPLRWTLLLERVSRRAVLRIARELSSDVNAPALELQLRGSRVPRAAVLAGGERLGQLPADQAKFLHEIGEHAALYTPQLCALRVNAEGELAIVEIELVRPELHSCEQCGSRHAGPHLVCEDCQNGTPGEKSTVAVEAPPIALQEALDALVSDEAKPAEG
jgi:hypothetical protein